MKRILLFGDSRWRDAFGLSLLRYKLLQLDFDCRVISLDLWQPAIELFNPHVVVLPHVFGVRNRTIANYVKRHGGMVAVIPTEGRPDTSDREDWFISQDQNEYLDLFLSWNDIITKRMTKAVTAGCPRFDIYQEPYKHLIDTRERALERYGVNPNKKTIGITSSFPQAKFS